MVRMTHVWNMIVKRVTQYNQSTAESRQNYIDAIKDDVARGIQDLREDMKAVDQSNSELAAQIVGGYEMAN